jgi:hypothetical protein
MSQIAQTPATTAEGKDMTTWEFMVRPRNSEVFTAKKKDIVII